MQNTLVFNDYDMVVSYTQAAINDQLLHLTEDLETIHPKLVLYEEEVRNADGGYEYTYVVCESADEIPRDAEGNPTTAYIDVRMVPEIRISESGYKVVLVLGLKSGRAAFWEGKRHPELVTYQVDDWRFGLIVDLNLVQVAEDAENAGLAVPAVVADALQEFNSSGFQVSALFMDFQSTELVTFDPKTTDVGDAGDQALEGLNDFIAFYIASLKEEGNPYVLGYSITTTEDADYDPDENVPDPLKPVATTFSLYYDSGNHDHSNLNYVLATAGGHGAITAQPDWFSYNWFRDDEQVHGKMYYSKNVLVERYVLRPIYDSLRDDVHAAIEKDLKVDKGNTYDEGTSILYDEGGAAVGYSYVISDDRSGDHKYDNRYTAVVANRATETVIELKGRIFMKMKDSKTMPLDTCVAEVWSSCSIDWSGTVSIRATEDAEGNPVLTIGDPVVQIDGSDADNGMNPCAKDWAEATAIIGQVVSLWGTLTDPAFLTKAVMKGLDFDIDGIGDIGDVFRNLGNGVTNVLMLPAGDTFYFQNPTMDGSGHFCLDLTFKN